MAITGGDKGSGSGKSKLTARSSIKVMGGPSFSSILMRLWAWAALVALARKRSMKDCSFLRWSICFDAALAASSIFSRRTCSKRS